MILVFDLAKRTGWAAADRGRLPVCGEVDLIRPSMTIEEGEEEALAKLYETALDLIGVHSPREIWIEEPMFTRDRSMLTLRFLMGLPSIVRLAAKRSGIPIYDVATGTIRLQVLGNGAAGKEGVLWWCHDNDWAVPGDNAADALCLLAYAACCENPLWRLTPGPNAQAARNDIFGRAKAGVRGQGRPAA